jgi:hypothetical protein
MSPGGGHITQGGGKVTTNTILILLALGGVGGWFFGRSWAEDARAEYDMKKLWNARQNYRKSDSE